MANLKLEGMRLNQPIPAQHRVHHGMTWHPEEEIVGRQGAVDFELLIHLESKFRGHRRQHLLRRHLWPCTNNLEEHS